MDLPLYVIGGGLGGLSAALHAHAAGRDVIILEKNEQIGGKCNQFKNEGYTFDTGPSVLTLPFIIDELFRVNGARREDYLEFERVEPGCRYFFPDGSKFDAPANLKDFRESIREHFPEELKNWHKFEKYTQSLWDISGPAFLFNPLGMGLLKRLNWKLLPGGFSALLPATMHQVVSKTFQDKRLIQLFDRFATYNGSSPYQTPATFNVISFVELAFGSWRCKGGMFALVEALKKLANDVGIRVHCNSEVRRIRFSDDGVSVKGVELSNGDIYPTDSVIVNQDAIQAMTGSLMSLHPNSNYWRQKWIKGEPSLSGFVMMAGWDRTFPELDCHNVIFPQDYEAEFEDLFKKKCPVRDPTIYISIPSKKEDAMAPEGKEGWFILVNAPALDDQGAWPDVYSDQIWKTLEKKKIIKPGERPRFNQVLPPSHFKTRYGAWKGTLYGHSSNHLLSAFRRVKQKQMVDGLSFAGGSAHPGGGIPLVILSGRLSAEALTGKKFPALKPPSLDLSAEASTV